MSLGRFQNCNPLEMDHFHRHGVEDEPHIQGDVADKMDEILNPKPVATSVATKPDAAKLD